MGYFPGLADREAELATARANLTGVHLPIAQIRPNGGANCTITLQN